MEDEIYFLKMAFENYMKDSRPPDTPYGELMGKALNHLREAAATRKEWEPF